MGLNLETEKKEIFYNQCIVLCDYNQLFYEKLTFKH